ncbi:MAG: hypothetical protein IJV14_09755 [Lachnospiraceae bacterium]|nr:hypothetical protein [Lachnospiraceae bacterium]
MRQLIRKYGKTEYIRLVVLLAVILASCIVFSGLDRLLCIKSQAGVNQARAFYYQPKDTIDVVFMGTSHTHCNINTAWLWEEEGVAGYDLSGAEQPIWMTYYYLKEVCRRQTPSLIVIDVYAPAFNQEDYHYKWIEENILGMRFGVNKVKMLLDSVERGRIKEFFPSFAVYHSRWREIGDEDRRALFHMKEDAQAYKGFTPFTNTLPMEQPQVWQMTEEDLAVMLGSSTGQAADVSLGPSYGLTQKAEEYLRKIIAFTKEENIPLLFINAPYPVTEAEQSVYNQIRDVASMEGIPFMDFNHCVDLMGLDYASDFTDETHLKVQGSIKYTAFLWKVLSSRYNIPQHPEYVDLPAEESEDTLSAAGTAKDVKKNNPYESWNRHVRSIRKDTADNS